MNLYVWLGCILSLAGSGMILLSFQIVNGVYLESNGLAVIILGFTCVGLAYSRPRFSPEMSQLISKTGVKNVTTFLESLGVRSKAIYFPGHLNNGGSQALIPLTGELPMPRIQTKSLANWRRLMPGSEGEAIAITTVGNLSLNLLPIRLEGTEKGIYSALKYLLTRELDIAKGVKLDLIDSQINIEIRGSVIPYEEGLYYQCLGSPIASISAAVACEALGKPVRITEESNYKSKSRISLEVSS